MKTKYTAINIQILRSLSLSTQKYSQWLLTIKIERNRSRNHTKYNAILQTNSQMYRNTISHISLNLLILQPHIAKQHFLQW